MPKTAARAPFPSAHPRTALALLGVSAVLALLPACGGDGGGAANPTAGNASAAGTGAGAGPSTGTPATLGARFDLRSTVTIYVGGFDPHGAAAQGPFGVDHLDAEAQRLATLLGAPRGDVSPLAPDQLTSLEFYGAIPPATYSAQDTADVQAASRGVPRYAHIVAKFARDVLARSGARHVNLVAASLGGMITRYVIEKDLEGLASGGRIARWVTLESAAGGVWAVSEPLVALFLATQLDPTDGLTLSYDWTRHTFGTPDPRRSVSPFFADMLVGHQLSGLGDPQVISLAALEPNDGTLLVRDQWLHTYDARAARGMAGACTLHTDTSHRSVRQDVGALGGVVNFLRSSRRATLTLVRVTVLQPVESAGLGACEVAIEAGITSPEAAREWGHAGEISKVRASSGTAPLAQVLPGVSAGMDATLFDWPLAPGERTLGLRLTATEENLNPFYRVYESILDPRQRIGECALTLAVDAVGSRTIVAGNAAFEAVLTLDVRDE